MGILTKLLVLGGGVFAYKQYQKKQNPNSNNNNGSRQCQRRRNNIDDFPRDHDSETVPPQYPHSDAGVGDVKKGSNAGFMNNHSNASMSGAMQHYPPEKY